MTLGFSLILSRKGLCAAGLAAMALLFSPTSGAWAGANEFGSSDTGDGVANPGASKDASVANLPTNGSANNPPKSINKQNLSQFSTNEQSRIYQRANENLITQTMYLRQSMEDASSIYTNDLTGDGKDGNIDGSTDDGQRLQERIQTTTSNYCADDAVKTYGDARACLDQFRQMRATQLREIKGAMLENSDTIARLRGNLSEKGKSGSGPSGAPTLGVNIKARVFPKIPTFEDLSKDNFKDIKAQAMLPKLNSKAEVDQFVAKVVKPPMPDCVGFYKTGPVLQDPDNPDDGTFLQVLRDPKTNAPIVDKEACGKAQTYYEQMIARGVASKSDRKTSLTAAQKISERIQAAIARQQQKQATALTMAQAVGKPTDDLKPQDCGNLSGPRQDYCLARNLVVMYFNGEAPNQKPPATKSKSQGRQIATTTPTGSAAGTSPGQGTEGYVLKAEKAAQAGDEEQEHLYMNPSDIDTIINDQFK